MASLDKFLEWFHDGRESEYNNILKVFKKTRNFLKIIVNRKLQNHIDIKEIPESEFRDDPELFDFIMANGFLDDSSYNDLEDILKNYYLEYWIEKNPNDALKYICDNILTDVEVRSDGYWLKLRDRDELAVFFDDRGRDGTAQDVAKHVFSEDMWDNYWDTTSDVYRDVIEDIDDNNKKHLGSYILREIGNQDLNVEDYSADFFHELAEVQARDGFFQITQDDVMNLIEDSEAMNELLDGDLDELKSELDSLHSSAYNNAYEEECYDLVYKGLDKYFSSKIMEETKQVGEKTKYIPYIKIRDFKGDVMAFIYENKGKGYNDSTLEYWGSYTGMMEQLFNDDVYDEIDFRTPDYADWNRVGKNIDDMFQDYVQ